ncbi:MAG TPA: hypothetical protein VMM84_09135 [Pyrinomonadaceae bacterium]|nr:hypothetical protein [Pyrinomonadaceae bacterium]
MTDDSRNLEDDYRVQDDYEDRVVEYAASPEQAGCGCGSTLVVLALVAAVAFTYRVVMSW